MLARHEDTPQDHTLMFINSINQLQCLFCHQHTIITQNRQGIHQEKVPNGNIMWLKTVSMAMMCIPYGTKHILISGIPPHGIF